MAPLTTLNRISIAEICVYTPSFGVALVLAKRHGISKSAGWYYLVLFSVIRIIGAALQLATINDPDNVGLIVGSMTLQSAGLSPLILVQLGLLSRVMASVSRTADPILQPRAIRMVQILVLVGLILSIVGGSKLGDNIGDFESTQPQPKAAGGGAGIASVTIPAELQAGIALMIAGFAILVGGAATLALQLRAVERGERRLLGAVAAAAPFVLVRIIYSAISTFSSNPDFRWYAGSSRYTIFLISMDIAMEMGAIVVIEAIGLTVRRILKGVPGTQNPQDRELGAVPTGTPTSEASQQKNPNPNTPKA